eukprot:9468827-Pyramimonas_sp.AAC.1
MTAGGFEYQTYALAAHGLAALQQGTAEVLGVRPDDSASISETTVYRMRRNYKARPSQEAERTTSPIPVSYRACQGHSAFVASSERRRVPYDPGLARCHGPLPHITDMETLLESMVGK